MKSIPLRPAPLLFATTLALVSATLSLPGELAEVKRALALPADDLDLRLVVLAALLSKSLVALLVGIGPLLLGGHRLGDGAIRGLVFAWTVLVFGAIGVDLELQRNTGNHLVDYLPHLLDPEALVWVGPGFDVGPSLLRVAGRVSLAVGPALAIAWLLERRTERWTARGSARGGSALRATLLGLALVATAMPVALSRSPRAASVLDPLAERMPWAGLTRIFAGPSRFAEVEQAAQAAFERVRPRLDPPRSLARLLELAPPPHRPDVLLVVVESLRADALDPETMPALWAWSARGLRASEHGATSNASHYGFFALLYGRSPLLYFETLDAGERPTLPALLGAWGYERHHLTCSDVAWREMERFMGSAELRVERLRARSLPDCDAAVVARASALLAERDRAPRFVLAFLASTHFGYHHPEEATPFLPSLPPPNALELDPVRDRAGLVNRYRNSAHAVDARIGALLEPLDPEALLVVVTGDHGEALFDDGTIAHASRLSDAQTRVPLVITGPGIPPGAAPRGPTDHADLLPTLLARLGVPADGLRALPGRDLLAGGSSSFSPRVAARARRGADDLVVLATEARRFAWRLDGERRALRFLGGWTRDGRPSREPVSERDGATAVRLLERYLESLSDRRESVRRRIEPAD